MPEIVAEFVDVPDEHLTNLGSKGLGEPPIIPTAAAIANAIRDATGADVRSLPITREEMLRALREARERTGARLQLLRPSSLEEASRGARRRPGDQALAGGTELVPLLRDRLVEAETLVELADVVPRGIQRHDDRRRHDARRARGRPEIPEALREACRLAASPQLRAMGTIGGNLLQATRCWYWRLQFPCWLHGGERCLAQAGQHREHAIFGNELCASAHPSDPAAALLALGARLRTDRRELPVDELYRLPTDDDRCHDDARSPAS